MRKFVLALAFLVSTVCAALAAEHWTDDEVAAGMKKVEFVRFAPSGKTMNLRFLLALNPDCSVVDYEFAITKQAEHGKAEIVPHADYSTYTKDNPRAKCNEQKIEGFMLTYKSNNGYTGPDSFTYWELTPSGLAREVTYHLNVRSFETPRPTKGRDAKALPPPRP